MALIDPTAAPGRPRPWQRLAVRLAAVFVLVTLLTVGVVGALVHQRQSREVEDTIGTQLLNIARVSALLVEPTAHADAARLGRADSAAYRRVTKALKAIRDETLLTTPLRTLADYDRASRRARVVVTTADDERPGQAFTVASEAADLVAWTFEDGVARYSRIYRTTAGMRISAFAPIPDARGQTAAVLEVDYPVDFYFDRLRELDTTILLGMLVGTGLAIILAVVFARHLTRPIVALTGAAGRVAGGDLSLSLAVRSRDEVGQLTGAFNAMVEGLRQREVIRNAFGRYVSPEVAQAVLDSPDGLRLGGRKREITVLMSDLRGYTRFAEHGDPAGVMEVLNDYLGRMADIVIEHGGTINEFIGDAIFAVFGAPIEHVDHAERAAATALAMQAAMETLNESNAARGRPRFEMGIGINTGEAVVGNIGSEQRTKYAVVGAAVNLAARVEGCTVGGQTLMTESTVRYLGPLADVAPPFHAELKGLDAPVALYELRGLRGGRWAQHREPTRDPGVAVALPLVGWVIEGKQVHAESFTGEVRRLGRRYLDVALDAPLAPLTNVRVRLTWAGSGRASGDVYGKVTGEAAGLVRIHLTSVDPGDATLLESARVAAEAS
ncbi:MAG TPA: adenylate/guanylate cyclase domain-containing protein [Methylomirabilota bacterium]|nr:adenylate/guanylate cyclase domain-containing protein [Methylomirabilota bacterium]